VQRDDFNALVEKARANHPRWFELERDAPADEQRVRDVELAMGVQLPEAYRSFLLDHGGGYFAFVFVFGVDADSDWFIVERNRERPPSFLAVTDPGTGDLCGFIVDAQGRCSSEVTVLDHETHAVSDTGFADFYEMIAARALET
jgi:hypothetical protein